MSKHWIGAIVVVLGLVPATALAQRSNFGTVRLTSGFTPDPHAVAGVSGGAQNGAGRFPGCNGWISRTPDHIFVATSAFAFLRIFAESSADTTIIVQGPGGTRCNDDTYGLNPSVEGAFRAGTYRVWIGSYQEGENSRYQLKLTELANVVPGSSAGAGGGGGVGGGGGGTGPVDTSGSSTNFGAVRLSSGFMPDPHRAQGTSGGAVDASTVANGCNGWISRRPDHALDLTSQFQFFRVFITSDSDTTLVIRAPNGQWLCDDYTNGLNPAIDRPSWARGRYLVWIGSYRQGESAAYNAGFTELSNVHE
jgi:hypothetical protein